MNPRVSAIAGSLIRQIAEKKGPGAIDLGLGEPSLMPNRAHLEAGIAYAYERGLRYTVNAGDMMLRSAIAAHYAYPGMARAENVCITTGSQEATYAVLKTVLDPARDELLVVEPAFPSYAKMAKMEGIAVRAVAMSEADDFGFDPERILAAVVPATRLIVICSPCNPTARTMTRAAVESLGEALLRRGGDPVFILHDEIYREQTFIDDPGYFAHGYPHTIVTNSVSKSNALTGLRLGWTIAPDAVAPGIVKVHAWLTSCADAFAQRVALHIFEQGALDEHAAWYADRRRAVLPLLDRSGLRYIVPEGSFYACVRLPDGLRSLDAATMLVEHHDVVAIPGAAFGEAFEGWLRLAWVGDVDRFGEGLQRIADATVRSVLR